MPLTQTQINDLVTATLFADKKKRVSNLDPTLLRNYVAGRRLVKKSQVVETGGKQIRFNVNIEGSDAAEAIGLYHEDEYGSTDHLAQGTMDIKFIKTHFIFDELEEVFNSNEYEIVDYIKNRDMQADISLMKMIENKFWSFADTTDTLSPQGVLYWFPYCASAGFVGTYPGSHTTIAGIDPVTKTGWKSYGDVYAAINQDDLILKLRTAWTETQFEAPLDQMPIKDYNTGDQYGLYTNLDVVLQMENELRNQNDNLGPDVDAMGGRAQFRRTPFVEVAALRSNARDPIIGLNWGLVKNHVLRGWWMKRKMVQAPTQALVTAVNKYCGYQIVCMDRRQGGFNIAKAA